MSTFRDELTRTVDLARERMPDTEFRRGFIAAVEAIRDDPGMALLNVMPDRLRWLTHAYACDDCRPTIGTSAEGMAHK